MRFRDREEAGHRLAELLEAHRLERPIVVAVPRGGVPVAFEVARALGARLDVLLVRRIRKGSPEHAIGAEAEGGGVYVDREASRAAGLGERDLAEIASRQSPELTRRVREYRRAHPAAALAARIVILVDDGVATGATALAAARAVRNRGASRLILAVPVIGSQGEIVLRGQVDEIVALERPLDVSAVADWYEHYDEVTDDEVLAYLRRAPAARMPAAAGAELWDGEWIEEEVSARRPRPRPARRAGSSEEGAMLRQIIDKEVSAVKHAVHAVREWIRPTTAMKDRAFERPLDDLGQNIDDVERRAEPSEPSAPRSAPRA